MTCEGRGRKHTTTIAGWLGMNEQNVFSLHRIHAVQFTVTSEVTNVAGTKLLWTFVPLW